MQCFTMNSYKGTHIIISFAFNNYWPQFGPDEYKSMMHTIHNCPHNSKQKFYYPTITSVASDFACYTNSLLGQIKKIQWCEVLCPTDLYLRKNRVVFFFIFFLCQIWAKNLLKFVFNGLKKHLHDLYMRFDCIPPKFSPFRNLKKSDWKTQLSHGT